MPPGKFFPLVDPLQFLKEELEKLPLSYRDGARSLIGVGRVPLTENQENQEALPQMEMFEASVVGHRHRGSPVGEDRHLGWKWEWEAVGEGGLGVVR